MKKEQWKTLLEILAIPVSILVSFGVFVFWIFGFFGGRVEQEVRNRCDGETVVATYIWYDGELIKAYYTPIDSLKENTLKLRREEAQRLLDNLQK